MTKKITSVLMFMFLCFGTFAQTIVSTDPENKKVVLEEFTGIHCVFCPQGHAIAQALKNGNPDNVFLINIHSGSFANPNNGEPDFRTPFGQAIDNQSGLAGYPAGTVNRRNLRSCLRRVLPSWTVRPEHSVTLYPLRHPRSQ